MRKVGLDGHGCRSDTDATVYLLTSTETTLPLLDWLENEGHARVAFEVHTSGCLLRPRVP